LVLKVIFTVRPSREYTARELGNKAGVTREFTARAQLGGLGFQFCM